MVLLVNKVALLQVNITKMNQQYNNFNLLSINVHVHACLAWLNAFLLLFEFEFLPSHIRASAKVLKGGSI